MRLKKRNTLKVLAKSGAVLGTASLIPSKWTQPIVDSVLIPTHAQTSPMSCSISDVVGTWEFAFTGESSGQGILNSDGSVTPVGGGPAGTWSLSGDMVTIVLDISNPNNNDVESTLEGTLGSNCRTMDGTVTITDNSGAVTNTNTFSGTKV